MCKFHHKYLSRKCDMQGKDIRDLRPFVSQLIGHWFSHVRISTHPFLLPEADFLWWPIYILWSLGLLVSSELNLSNQRKAAPFSSLKVGLWVSVNVSQDVKMPVENRFATQNHVDTSICNLYARDWSIIARDFLCPRRGTHVSPGREFWRFLGNFQGRFRARRWIPVFFFPFGKRIGYLKLRNTHRRFCELFQEFGQKLVPPYSFKIEL